MCQCDRKLFAVQLNYFLCPEFWPRTLEVENKREARLMKRKKRIDC